MSSGLVSGHLCLQNLNSGHTQESRLCCAPSPELLRYSMRKFNSDIDKGSEWAGLGELMLFHGSIPFQRILIRHSISLLSQSRSQQGSSDIGVRQRAQRIPKYWCTLCGSRGFPDDLAVYSSAWRNVDDDFIFLSHATRQDDPSVTRDNTTNRDFVA